MVKKIIFVPFLDAFGGVERLILSLAKYLHESGESYKILCFRDTIGLAEYADFPVDVVVLNPARNSFIEGWCLGRYLRQVRSTKVLVFDLNGAFYAGMFSPAGYTLHLTDPPSLLPTDISKYAPSITGKQNLLSGGMKAELMHRLNKRGINKAHHVIAMTHKIQHELSYRYGVNSHVVRPGIEVGGFQKSQLPDSGQFHFLSVCRLEDNKRLDWIIHALNNMECSASPLSNRFNWVLDLVGAGPNERDLKSLAESLGLTERVIFHGRVTDEELEQRYCEANMFLMPAVQGYGLPALEALSRNIPVVLHRDSGVSEILGGSPWASIISDNKDSLELHIETLVQRIESGNLSSSNLPAIPSDTGWAEEICNIWKES